MELEAGDPARRGQRGFLGDGAAQGEAEQMGPLDLERVQEPQQVGGQATGAVRLVRRVAAARPPVVEGEHAVARRQRGELEPPRGRVAPQAHHQHDRRPLRAAVPLVVEPEAVDGDVRHGRGHSCAASASESVSHSWSSQATCSSASRRSTATARARSPSV